MASNLRHRPVPAPSGDPPVPHPAPSSSTPPSGPRPDPEPIRIRAQVPPTPQSHRNGRPEIHFDADPGDPLFSSWSALLLGLMASAGLAYWLFWGLISDELRRMEERGETFWGGRKA